MKLIQLKEKVRSYPFKIELYFLQILICLIFNSCSNKFQIVHKGPVANQEQLKLFYEEYEIGTFLIYFDNSVNGQNLKIYDSNKRVYFDGILKSNDQFFSKPFLVNNFKHIYIDINGELYTIEPVKCWEYTSLMIEKKKNRLKFTYFN